MNKKFRILEYDPMNDKIVLQFMNGKEATYIGGHKVISYGTFGEVWMESEIDPMAIEGIAEAKERARLRNKKDQK